MSLISKSPLSPLISETLPQTDEFVCVYQIFCLKRSPAEAELVSGCSMFVELTENHFLCKFSIKLGLF